MTPLLTAVPPPEVMPFIGTGSTAMSSVLSLSATQSHSFRLWLEAVGRPFDQIESWRDLELWLLQGQGLSPHTYYGAYLTALKQFYRYSEGLHPLQWTPELVESFYDALRLGRSRATAYLRMEGMKHICRRIALRIPWFTDPFLIMSGKTKAKLAAAPRGVKKTALYQSELDAVLSHLKADGSLKARQTLAMIAVLVTSGLRAQELCELAADSVEHDTDSGRWYLSGIGKGGKPFHVEVHPRAISLAFSVFRSQFGRSPRRGEPLFYGAILREGRYRPMKRAALWARMHELGEELKRERKIRSQVQFSAHLFRRTWASQCIKGVMDLAALADAGRWSSLETLQRHYADTLRTTLPYTERMLRVLS